MGKNTDFGVQVARMMPAFIKEILKKQESIFTKGNLAVAHIIVLDILREIGTSSMGDMARNLNMSMSAATGIIDKMVTMELVDRERSDEDRRVVNVILTEKGKDMAVRVNEERKYMLNEMFAVLTDAERDEYLALLKKVYDGLSGEGQ